MELRQLQAAIAAQEWQAVEYRTGTKERLEREAVRIPVFLWTGAAAEVETVWLLISRELNGKKSNTRCATNRAARCH